MFKLENIKVLHLEPTTVCQAACPQCGREDPEFYKDKQHRSDLSLDEIKNKIPESVVRNLDKMFMCGNFGDPAASKQCIEIYKWFRNINPDITLGMNTNGALKDKKWWYELGSIFTNPEDYVVFSIDGLEDTNHIYRKNVSWKKLIENASSFIQAGGSAHWDMLIFEYNEHQVDDCQKLAKEMGFSWFRCKVSKRFFNKPIDFLRPPQNWNVPNVTKPTEIRCHAKQEKSMYMAANGELFPCCWIGSHVFKKTQQLENVLKSKHFTEVEKSWHNTPLDICSNNCGVKKDTNTSFSNQWQREVELC